MTSLQTTSKSTRNLTFRVATAGSTPLYSSKKRVATSTTVSSCAPCFQIPVELIRSRRSIRVLESVLLCWTKTSIICTIPCTYQRMVRRKASLVPRRAAHQRRIEDVAKTVLVWYAILPHHCARFELKGMRQQCRLASRYRNVLSDSGSHASSLRLSRRREPPHRV